jgi:hypothetical protein
VDDVLTALERVTLLRQLRLGHDIDHPGFCQRLSEVVACTSLAIRYNDTSVLESHHCSSLFAILSSAALRRVRDAAARRLCHNSPNGNRADSSHRSRAAQSVHRSAGGARPRRCCAPLAGRSRRVDGHADAANARRVLLCGLIKCADLCNEIRTFALSQRWVPLVLEEFFAQGDAEKQRGFPVGFTNDRDKVTARRRRSASSSFSACRFMVRWCEWRRHFSSCIDNLNANLKAMATPASMTEQQLGAIATLCEV